MPICSNCKAEYIRGKRICSFCGQELYRGLMIDLSEDDNIFSQVEWTKIINVHSEQEADIIIKQLYNSQIPAIKRDGDIPFMDVAASPIHIDIYVPNGTEEMALKVIN